MRFILSLGLIFLSAFVGYIARTRGLIKEAAATGIMTIVTVAGYPLVGFLSIWGTPLYWSHAWLPVLGGIQATLLALFALAAGRRFFHDRAELGVIGFSCGIGNHGITMAGFVVYLLFGTVGLGLNTIYAMYTFFALVLLSYTIAQVHAPNTQRRSIPNLMLSNLLHWRASGLYACVTAILLTAFRIQVPQVIHSWHILDVCIYLLIALAYFAIGLRLHLPHVWDLRKSILYMIIVRHGIGLVIGCALVALTFLTPWPLTGLPLKIFIIQASVPAGVMAVAVANMYHIKPREAAALFVVSSAVYLILGIPLILWIFSG